jgi:hypothetical protein
MRQVSTCIAIALGVLAAPVAVQAATVVVTGTITTFVVLSTAGHTAEGGVVQFMLSNQPTATGCSGGNATFAYSAASVTDPTTRNNMTATLLAAYTAGLTVNVAYDNAGAACDPEFNYAVPLTIFLG